MHKVKYLTFMEALNSKLKDGEGLFPVKNTGYYIKRKLTLKELNIKGFKREYPGFHFPGDQVGPNEEE